MIRAFLIAVLLMFAKPGLAQWETTNFVPIPYTGYDADDVISGGFFDLITPPQTQAVNGNVTYDSIDFALLKRGAPAALTTIFQGISLDAKKMALAGFPKPFLSPVLTSQSGDRHYPIFWNKFPPHLDTTLAAQHCSFGSYPLILVNTARLSYQTLNDQWLAGLENRALMLDYTSATLTHEVMHAVQGNGGTKWGCNRQPGKKWVTEGTADGVANYLLNKRVSGALKKYRWARNERSYASPLYSDDERLAYASGSFFRFLIEATEIGGKSDMSIMRDIIKKMTTADISSRSAALTAIQRIVRQPHANNRPLSIVFAEFATEYASYAQRYGIGDASWVYRGFGGCAEYQISPGAVVTQTVGVRRNAARCLKVEWSGFTSAVALQIYLEGTGVDEGSLHLGEAIREHDDLAQTWRCYDVVTRHLDNRLARPAEEKCIMHRGAIKSGAGSSGPVSVNGWTSDFNVFGDGYAYLILANAAEDIAATKPVSVNLTIGTLLAKKKGGTALAPRQETPNPVMDGKTLIDSRVHAMTGGPGRAFFDGRSVFGDSVGLGFLEGVPGAGEINSSATVIRSKDYWVVLSKDKPGFPDGGMILKNPDQAAGAGAIMTLGIQGMQQMPSCGYQIPAQLTVKEDTKERIVFEVSGDLFRFSPQMMMSAGSANFCNFLNAAHVEHQSIEVALPWSDFYKASTTTRFNPPMQDLYEREFGPGPSFGGIGSARSLVLGDETDPNESDPDGTGETAEDSNASSASDSLQCTCHCPDIVNPPTGTCFETCESQLNFCPAPTSAQARQADSDLYSSLLEKNALSDDVSSMLRQDFDAMSAETRSQILREVLSE